MSNLNEAFLQKIFLWSQLPWPEHVKAPRDTFIGLDRDGDGIELVSNTRFSIGPARVHRITFSEPFIPYSIEFLHQGYS